MREHKGKSIIDLPQNYIVLDIETTGLDYEFCDIIEVCAIRYSNGQQIDKFSSLIRPREKYYLDFESGEWIPHYVDKFITELTGITDEMLASAPVPNDVIPSLMNFLGDSILVAHNANFDINFVYDAVCECCNDVMLCNNFVDTLRVARKVFPDLAHHRLSDIAQACSISQSSSHRAEADCIVTAQCFEVMRKKVLLNGGLESFRNHFYSDRNYRLSLQNVTATVDHIDDTNPIFKKVVVFTGALSSMSRTDAFQVVANLGGFPADSITAKTNYLVIGKTDFAKSVKDGKSNKMKKAESYQIKGAEIAIISEDAFFDLISDYL